MCAAAAPHQWRSDPATALPAWCTLAWDAPVAVRQVELTFPGNLLRSYHAYHPFYRAPETARDYRLLLDGTVILEVTGNYQRRRAVRGQGVLMIPELPGQSVLPRRAALQASVPADRRRGGVPGAPPR